MSHAKETGQHRAQPPGRRRAAPTGKRRAEVRPRYGRIAVLTASVTVTGISVLGGFGLLPSGPQGASAASGSIAPAAAVRTDPPAEAGTEPRAEAGSGVDTPSPEPRTYQRVSVPPETAPTLPAGSGSGRRIVFSESAQRVWLVDASDEVLRTHLVSGSLTDNLDPGTYQVYSRSRYAVGIDDSGTMQYFVRFTQGDTGAAIGFHSIPVLDGEPVQTLGELGTPQSHGCVRQRTADAIALWRFAPIGTTVVVTA